MPIDLLCCYDGFINRNEFVFDSRTRRPPRNEVNAMISFGNTLLYSLISREIQKTALDVRVGFLHATNKRHETLNLDIAEIFQDVGAYETARDKLKQNDIQVAVDMNATELDRLDADLLTADFLRVPAGCVWEGKTPLIWKRCLDANYLIAGKEKGVVLFEGPAIDAFCQALEV